MFKAGKTLLVPTPRLRSGLLNRIKVSSPGMSSLRTCASMQVSSLSALCQVIQPFTGVYGIRPNASCLNGKGGQCTITKI